MPSFERRSGKTHSLEGGPDIYLSRSQPVWAGHLVPGIRGLRERGFSTALGNLHERIALVIGEYAHAEVRRAFDLTGQLPVLAREFITQRIDQLSRGEAAPDHPYEREQLLHAFGDEVPAATRIDLWLKTHSGEDHYFEIKARSRTAVSASR